MAKGAVKQRPKEPKPAVSRRREKQPKSWEEELFFARLRNHAKWMFVFLALVFGVGFVAFGVGTGSDGLTSIIQDNILASAGTGGDVEDARDRVKENPNDPAAHLALARALQADDKRDEAIAPMERYTRMRPRDADGLRELASLYLVKGQTFQDEGQIAQAEAQEGYAAPFFLPPPSTQLGQALGTDPIYQAVSSLANEQVTAAVTGMQEAFRNAVATYQRLVALNPQESNAHFELAQTAEQAGDLPTAITSYERFLELAPQDPTAPAVRDRVKQLKASQAQTEAQAQSAPAPTG